MRDEPRAAISLRQAYQAAMHEAEQWVAALRSSFVEVCRCCHYVILSARGVLRTVGGTVASASSRVITRSGQVTAFARGS